MPERQYLCMDQNNAEKTEMPITPQNRLQQCAFSQNYRHFKLHLTSNVVYHIS